MSCSLLPGSLRGQVSDRHSWVKKDDSNTGFGGPEEIITVSQVVRMCDQSEQPKVHVKGRHRVLPWEKVRRFTERVGISGMLQTCP